MQTFFKGNKNKSGRAREDQLCCLNEKCRGKQKSRIKRHDSATVQCNRSDTADS